MNSIPGLTKGKFGFEGDITLKAWQGFQTRKGPYASIDSDNGSDGIFRISTGGDMVDNHPEVKDFHVMAYKFLTEHQEKIKNAILISLFAEYQDIQADYGYKGDEKNAFMPDISVTDDFKRLIGLANVHLLNVEKEGFGYVGYEFGCTWDGEHGLGIMTHKDRIIKIGGADISFLTWVANRDLKPEIDAHRDDPKKPWWKFW